ncbi:MAG: glycosyltransferase [Novosphingobium sp.]
MSAAERLGPAEAPHWVLLLEDDEDIAALICDGLIGAGYHVVRAENGEEGLALLAASLPDLIVSDVMMPVMDGFTFLDRVRADRRYRAVPVILLTTKNRVIDVVTGFGLGADDYLAKPFQMDELIARARSKMERPPVPAEEMRQDRVSGVMTRTALIEELRLDVARARRWGFKGIVACITLEELSRSRSRLDPAFDREIRAQIGRLLAESGDALVSVGRVRDGEYLLALPGWDVETARHWLARLAQAIVGAPFQVGATKICLTPSIGFCTFDDASAPGDLIANAQTAAEHASAHLDLQPARFTPAMLAGEEKRKPWLPKAVRKWVEKARLPAQMISTLLIAWVVPFAVYVACDVIGFDISGLVYIALMLVILLTALLIWIEGVLAMRRIDPPDAASYPPASAIIAAYLPNEADTLEATIEAFLRLDYPGALQIILAYNTPRDMAFEAVLAEIAARDPRFVPLRVYGSTSKAQNVNAALSLVQGEFVGVFDADHQPDTGSFVRAWNWLAAGFDVVQGHCFIRNGEDSWVARTVAIEFEQIYAVAHPGRARLHGFGIFGGSNGYWKTPLLRSIRMHGFMLTEDIDSSLRVIENGGRICSDPLLVSRELSPIDLKGLTNQRLRWAQGWFQVSLKRIGPLLRSPHLTLRNKLGAFHLLLWREIFPWLSLQIFPIVGFWAWRAGGIGKIDWFVPIFFILTLATLATGPGQVAFTWILADPAHKARRRWFASYLVTSLFFYTEYKNMLARVGQIKEFMGERAWKVTPRGRS